jgi:hypothetical protein
MASERLKAPIMYGEQFFERVISEGGIYIDKTDYIAEMLRPDAGSQYFLSRPRRFGKTLLLTTLKAYFQGKKHLFEQRNLALAANPEYQTYLEWGEYPIVHLDLGNVNYAHKKGLQVSLVDKLQRAFSLLTHNIPPYDFSQSLSGYFSSLIKNVCHSSRSSLVILIDEYDRPLLQGLLEPEHYGTIQATMRDFYSALKPSQEYIRFLFLTGISRFSKLNLFSTLNTLRDLTMESAFNACVGFTENEVMDTYKDHLQLISKELGEQGILNHIKDWYNGYRWGGAETVYNPIALSNYLTHKRLDSYWYNSGADSFFLVEKAKEYNLNLVEDLIQQSYQMNEVLTFEPNRIHMVGLLWQMGYLTIKEEKPSPDGLFYRFDFPNKDVKQAFLTNFIETCVPDLPPIRNWSAVLAEGLDRNDIRLIEECINNLFTSIPYRILMTNTKKNREKWESYYHSMLFTAFLFMNEDVRIEDHNRFGSRDLLLYRKDDSVWIMEVKHDPNTDAHTLVDTAMKQIHDKKYYQGLQKSVANVYLLGIGISNEGETVCKSETYSPS